MAFLEWRKFQFFDLKFEVDKGRISELFKDSRVTVTTSGNNHLVLGDSSGQIHLVARSWEIKSFRAYEMTVDLAHQLRNLPILVTIGVDEPGVNPLIKVWDTSRFDKNNSSPHCCRILRAIPGNRPINASVLCVHDALQLMAVGFVDGSLVLYRGDITRERGTKQKVLRDASSTVTGLAFKTTSTSIFLFLATDSSVIVYNITHKDKEHKFVLDNIGCAKKCTVLAESMQESHFMVGRNDAVYCYTTDGRGPCYAVDGEKSMLQWFRSYLVIVSKANQTDTITVLDIHNKFIVFSANLPSIGAIFNEWGAFYLLDGDNRLSHLDEKDLQSKLSLLFKKKLYDVAIRIAKSHQYDSDGLVEIFKQYGDHLCDKGDYVGAIEQYIKTIGKLESSYVIRKFLDGQHLDKLTMYLQALHKMGQASEHHTTLLLNCYTKLNNTVGHTGDNLKEFIQRKEGDLDYDVDVAIKACRKSSPQEALMLAKKHSQHDWYIKLLIEDHRDRYVDVIDYISTLDWPSGELYMKKFGDILIANEPTASTEFLKKLCRQNGDPDDFIHFYVNNSPKLIDLVEFLIGEGMSLSGGVYNTLLEHYLHVWGREEGLAERAHLSRKILNVLQDPEVRYDKSQALVVCHMHAFSDGILYLYEEQKLYEDILRYHIFKDDSNAILTCCRRFGNQEPTLWVQALWSCVRDAPKPSAELLNHILTVISKEKLLSPQLVVNALGGKADLTLSHIRTYVTNELLQEQAKTKEIGELTENYRKDTEKLKVQLDNLKSGTIVIQGSRCAACHHLLELPTIHFLCQHSYHQHCFQSFSEDDNECPACQPENKKLLELLKARECAKDLHETFHSQLEKAHDGFSVAAEYFGRGVFNRFKIITEESIVAPAVTAAHTIKSHQSKYSSSLEANITTSGNPFEVEAKNPFDDDDDDDLEEHNPFNEDYDKNLNPFYN